MTDERQGFTSASSAEADLLCPGRHIAQKLAPVPIEQSEDAEHGSIIHAALAKGDPNGLTLQQQETYEACVKIASDTASNFFGGAPVNMIKERRLWAVFNALINGNTAELRHSGKVDLAIVGETSALIIEFKTLAGEVPASSSNQQLRDQAVLVWGGSAVPTEQLGVVDYKIKRVGCVVVQPLVTHSPEVCIYEEADLIRAASELYERVMRSNNPQSQRVPGERQCKFCRATAHCREYQQWAASKLPMVPGSLVDTPVAQWTPEQRAVFESNYRVAKKWLDETQDAMKQLLKVDPESISGFTLRDGRTIREVTNPQALFDRFSLLPGVNGEDKFEDRLALYMGCIKVQFGALEEAVNKVTGLKGKRLENTMDKILEGVINESKSEPSIVKRSK